MERPAAQIAVWATIPDTSPSASVKAERAPFEMLSARTYKMSGPGAAESKTDVRKKLKTISKSTLQNEDF